tara:strand:+ start:29642 stop:30811 length:1170 start_codon:yes stop_codon:yes gene_type:complete
MQFKKFLFIISLAFSSLGFAQPELSSASKISLLTVGTADELYAKFGHSAIRIQDPTLQIDVIYNYGRFDFDTPNFYLKFTRGKLLYQLGRQSFSNFMFGYELENRWVQEQLLQLNQDERNRLFKFLENNYLPENRYYKYDFLFDNCSTRIPAALKTVLGDNLNFEYTHLKNQYTFRELLHQNLEVNSWSNFGIDLALGSVIDKKATPWEHMFLPIYVYKQLPYTKLNGKPLVTNNKLLLDVKPTADSSVFLLSPLFWLSVILVIVAFITFKDLKNKTRTRGLDFILFLTTGFAGLLILFLWFGTDHKATAYNYNFLWSFPYNLVVAFIMLKKGKLPKWTGMYFLAILLLLVIVLGIWLFKVQMFSVLIIPILIALAIRYSFLFYRQRSV